MISPATKSINFESSTNVKNVAGGFDVNGDGLHDFVITVSGGQGVLFYGQSDRQIASTSSTLASPESVFNLTEDASLGSLLSGSSTGFGTAVVMLPDFDGDGLADIAFTDSVSHKLLILFGNANGFGNSVSVTPTSEGTLPFANDGITALTKVASLGDLDGDGLSDLGVSLGNSVVIWFGQADRTETPRTVELTNFSGTVSSLTGLDDFNGDGLCDIAVGQQSSARGAGGTDSGAVDLIFGNAAFQNLQSGAQLPVYGGTFPVIQLDGVAALDSFGSSLAGGSDLNTDGLSDLIIGVNGADLAGDQAVVIYGTTQSGSSAFTRHAIGGKPGEGINVAASFDFNGDGFDDVLYAQPLHDVGTNTLGRDKGLVTWGFGAPEANLNQIVGTNGADNLTGTAAADILVGAQGDDTISSLDGQDILQGAEGNDRLLVSGFDDRFIDGGRGLDTLVLSSDQSRIDYPELTQRAISGIESIELENTGAERGTFAITPLAVVNSSDTSNSLRLTFEPRDYAIDYGNGSFIWTKTIPDDESPITLRSATPTADPTAPIPGNAVLELDPTTPFLTISDTQLVESD